MERRIGPGYMHIATLILGKWVGYLMGAREHSLNLTSSKKNQKSLI